MQLLTAQQSNCDNIQYYEIEYQKRGSSERLTAMAPQSANAKNLTDDVEFDSEYWLVVIAHNNQPLDSSSNTVRIVTDQASQFALFSYFRCVIFQKIADLCGFMLGVCCVIIQMVTSTRVSVENF